MEEAKDYIALAIPVFFLLIGVELLVMKWSKTKLYRFNDAITNITCGISQQVIGILLKTFLMLGYLYLYNNFRFLLDFPNTWWSWILCFIGVDFCYYWFHRYSHEISLLWGGHIVHHQSEEYNLSVALRQGSFQQLFTWIFYLPLALIGFHPVMFLVVNQFQTLYQFWIHTKTIKFMPSFFEFIFNTPSHHRVHHGINPHYLDRNHGGTLIIWDRMFGTFAKEEEEVIYGITKPLQSWNPVWANLDYYWSILGAAWKTKKWKDKFLLFFKAPGWLPEDLGGPIEIEKVDSVKLKKYDTDVPVGLSYYVLVQFVIILAGASAFLFKAVNFEIGIQIALSILILLSVMSLGGIFESRKWALLTESLRMISTVGVFIFFTMNESYFIPALVVSTVIILISILWLFRFRKWLNRPAWSPELAVH